MDGNPAQKTKIGDAVEKVMLIIIIFTKIFNNNIFVFRDLLPMKL